MVDINKAIMDRIHYMENEKKASANYQELEAFADRIEEIRIELFNNPIIAKEIDERNELSDLLFRLQSELRYNVKEILDRMVILGD